MNRDAFLAYIVARGKEASTWRGLILVATALFGWNAPEEKVLAIITIGVFLAGAVGALLPDSKGTS